MSTWRRHTGASVELVDNPLRTAHANAIMGIRAAHGSDGGGAELHHALSRVGGARAGVHVPVVVGEGTDARTFPAPV